MSFLNIASFAAGLRNAAGLGGLDQGGYEGDPGHPWARDH